MEISCSPVSDAVAMRAEQSRRPGDYLSEDGLLVCGRCRTPKQTVIRCGESQRTVPCLCDCALAQRDAEETERRAKAFEQRKAALRSACFASYRGGARQTFAADDMSNRRISGVLRRYTDHWDRVCADGMGLLLYGGIGSGKSFYAACLANELIDRGIPALMTGFAAIVAEAQETGAMHSSIERISRYPLLILDDLGAERTSDYMLEQVYAVVDARYQTGKPLIVTTNLDIELIKNPPELRYRRIYDRVLEMCHPVMIEGGSRRRRAVRMNFETRQDLLGLQNICAGKSEAEEREIEHEKTDQEGR